MTRFERNQLWLGLSMILMAIVLLSMMVAFGGCGSWQKTLTNSTLGVEAGAKSAQAFVRAGPCSRTAIDTAGQACLDSKQADCPALHKCEVFHKVLWSVLAGVQATKLAIEAGDEQTARAAFAALQRLLPSLQTALEVWR